MTDASFTLTGLPTRTIQEAARELDAHAFQLWILLHTVPMPHRGRRSLAFKIGWHERTFSRHLRKLRRSGYVRVVRTTKPGSLGESTTITLEKRLAVHSPSHVLSL